MKELPYPYNQRYGPGNGAEEVYCEYYDTAGNYHWFGTMNGHHIWIAESIIFLI